MQNKKIVVFLGIVGTLLIVSVIGLFVLLGTNNDPAQAQEPGTSANGDPGLLGNPNNPMDPDPAEPVTKNDLQDQYQQQPDYNEAAVSQLEPTIMADLSTGDFSGLDSFLQEMAARFSVQTPTNEDGSVSNDNIVDYNGRVTDVRSDLAILASITPDNATMMFTSFNTPEVCAAAVIYTDILEKIDVFINMDGRIYNKVIPGSDAAQAVDFKVANLSDSELGDLLVTLNERHPDNQCLAVKAYDCVIQGLPYRILVAQQSWGKWRPYTVQSLCTNGEDSTVLTVYELQAKRTEEPNFDFSSLNYDIGGDYRAPGTIDRNEGEGFGPSDPNSTDPNAQDPAVTQDPNAQQTGDPNGQGTANDPTTQVSEVDEKALADLQVILDNFPQNTTDLTVIKSTIDSIAAIAARPGLSEPVAQALNEMVTNLQSQYDQLAAILAQNP